MNVSETIVPKSASSEPAPAGRGDAARTASMLGASDIAAEPASDAYSAEPRETAEAPVEPAKPAQDAEPKRSAQTPTGSIKAAQSKPAPSAVNSKQAVAKPVTKDATAKAMPGINCAWPAPFQS